MYELIGEGCAEWTLRTALEDLNVDWRTGPTEGTFVVTIADQSRLVAVIARLHDLGLAIEHIEHI